MAKPIMFDDMPTKRPHFFLLIAGRKYFALKKCASRFVAVVFRHVGRSNSSIVNTIGPIVDLTPGSISIAVDRLVEKGLVSRVESAEDRRVRIVALTPRGKALIDSAFRKHSGQMKRVLSELSPEELRGLETALKKVGKRAATLMEES
jgi:DNA-binding MarR family transcriptional regulator